jgi:hypothetical protein
MDAHAFSEQGAALEANTLACLIVLKIAAGKVLTILQAFSDSNPK